jgi:oligosaccharyltransferase complex subunit gamma
VLVFFDASVHHSKPGLHLPQLRSEFGLLAASFNARNPGSSDLFADIEFAESQHSFHQFGVNSLPHVRLIHSEHSTLAGSDKMDQSDFARLADSMAEFVESRTGLEVGPIIRPSASRSSCSSSSFSSPSPSASRGSSKGRPCSMTAGFG